MLSKTSYVYQNSNAIHVAFRRIAAPKVVRIIESYNNLHAFFVIFRVFGGFFEIFGAKFGLWACCSPTAGDAIERKASCSPPRWGGGELRDSKSRNTYYNILSGSSLRGSRNERMRIAGLRAPRLRPARLCGSYLIHTRQQKMTRNWLTHVDYRQSRFNNINLAFNKMTFGFDIIELDFITLLSVLKNPIV